jgi:branched-chain amino acid transport system substrate-binding protein
MGRTPLSQGVLNWTATDHFGYTPETGVLLQVKGGDWAVVP